mmetsp:Transcript_56804/g.118795  ORF Transcript_56804/g.118795 Transcript_56804/m.118795 type:complete len:322 (+) Transcript_56804:373-1338(+)
MQPAPALLLPCSCSRSGEGDDGERGALRHATHIGVALHLEVAVVPPPETPAVFDGPVAHPVLHPVPHRQHRVVHRVRRAVADGGRVDPRAVVPKVAHYLEGDGDGLVQADYEPHAVLVPRSEVDHALHRRPHVHERRVKPAGPGGGCAVAVAADVGVVVHPAQPAARAPVLEGLRRQPPVAPVVVEVPRAVHQLLLAEQNHHPGLDGVCGLERCNSAESPAASAFALVFHHRNAGCLPARCVPPIHFFWGNSQLNIFRERFLCCSTAILSCFHGEHVLEFLPGQITVFINSGSPGFFPRVYFGDFLPILAKYFDSCFKLHR